MRREECQTKLKQLNCTVIIPTYNNARTITDVIAGVQQYCTDIVVVNDGSTDTTHDLLSERTDITLIEYADGKNRGKGYALKTALRKACEMGYRYAITIDADGQHFADDIPQFVEATEKYPDSLIIGARNLQADGMPNKNTFANKFSNFWFKVETWISLDDTQSGFRLYPLKHIKDMRFITPRYEFEIEIIVRCAWRGVKISNIPIKVIYPEDRVSHFKPLRDFGRISVLNTVLVTIALLYYYPKCLIKWLLSPRKIIDFFKRNLFNSNESAARMSVAAGFGAFMGIIPIWGFQMIAAVALAHLLKLNKIIVLAFSNISITPVIPFIVYASLWTGGKILGNNTLPDIDNLSLGSALGSMSQYLIGSLTLACAAGCAIGLTMYAIINIIKALRRIGKKNVKTNS